MLQCAEGVPVQIAHQLVAEEGFASTRQSNQYDDKLLPVHPMHSLASLGAQTFLRAEVCLWLICTGSLLSSYV